MRKGYLSNLRKQSGFQQAYLAGQLGMTRQTYAQIEKGERDLTIPEAQKLAGLYNLSLTDFIEGKSPQETEVTIMRSRKIRQAVLVPADRIEKFKQTLLYILKQVGARPNIGETAIYKILYFIDFDYFEEFGEKLIGATYIKNIHGPTPVEFKKVVEEMAKADQLEVVKSKYFQYEQRKYLPKAEPDLTVISAREIKFIDKEIQRLADKNAKDLSNYSHGDAPWKITQEGQPIDYELVWERIAPYTEHDYDQEFMQAGASDMHKRLEPMTEEEYEYYMNLPDLDEKR